MEGKQVLMMSNKRFVGREEEKELFKDFLKKDKRLLIFLGERGIGKTALLEELHCSATESKHICAYFKCTGSADEETGIMKTFREKIGKDVTGEMIFLSKNFFTSFDDTLRKIESRKSQKDSGNLYKKLRKSFSYAVDGLSKKIGNDGKRLIFFFDETERLSPSIKKWLRLRVEESLRRDNNVFFVFATINDIDQRIIWKRRQDICEKKICEFTEDERKKYLAENLQEEKDSALMNSLSSVTGNPLALSLFCTIQRSEEIRDVINRIGNDKSHLDISLITIINEILQKVLNECDCKKIVHRSSVLRSFNEDILNNVLEKECIQEKCGNLKKCFEEGYLNKIKKTLLVEEVYILVCKNIYNIYKYHDQIRRLLYEELQGNIHVNCENLHQSFLDYYEKWYDRVSTDAEKSDLVLLEIIYHQLKIDEKKGLERARNEFNDARQSFNLSRCTRIISELEKFFWKDSPNATKQVIDFLQGKLAVTQGRYDYAIKKFDQVLRRRDLLIGKDELASEALVALGESYFLPGKHLDSLEKSKKVLERLNEQEEKYPIISASAHWIIGRIHRSQGNMEKADEHLKRCIDLSINTGNYYFAGYGLCTLGEIYQMQGDYTQAIINLDDSLHMMSLNGDENRRKSKEIIGRTLHILGRVHQFQGKWEKAKEELSVSLEIRREVTKDKPQHSLGYAYWGFGWFYLFQRNASAAIDDLEKSENIFETLNEKDGIARTYRLQAEVYLMQGDNEQAAELLRNAIAIQKEKKGNYELGLLHLGLTRYHIAMESWQEAIKTNEKARMLCEGSGDRWAQVKSDILQCQIDMHLSQYDDLEPRISKANIEVENFPDLMFELELVRGEYAVKTDRLDDGVEAYSKAYNKAKEFYHPDEHNADYVARVIYGQVQSLPQEKKEYLTNALPEIMSVAAE
ncbi:MAG: tetratricopeptide repeat protein [Candidatus Electrothrix sp. YB6]